MNHGEFSFERLHVHSDLLRFLSTAEEHVFAWDPVQAVVDQFTRASEGAVVTLAEASRAHQLSAKEAAVDCSLGSVLECAACMDVAEAKSLITSENAHLLKRPLVVIFKRLVALRESWRNSAVRETGASYGKEGGFHHERLDAYQLALKVIRELALAQLVERLSRGAYRRIDEPATSMVLNIAEGNGRFAHMDHQRFLQIANRATTKLAARLEIIALQGLLEPAAKDRIKAVLVRVDATTEALARTWSGQR
jgi:four helix bundle protein